MNNSQVIKSSASRTNDLVSSCEGLGTGLPDGGHPNGGLFSDRSSLSSFIGNSDTSIRMPVDSDPGHWKTYNFEVAEHHTYVADGVRVHNDSGWLGKLANKIDHRIDSFFDFQNGSFGDLATNVITAPLHIIGILGNVVIDGAVAAIEGLGNLIDRAGKAIDRALGSVLDPIADKLDNFFEGAVNGIREIFGLDPIQIDRQAEQLERQQKFNDLAEKIADRGGSFNSDLGVFEYTQTNSEGNPTGATVLVRPDGSGAGISIPSGTSIDNGAYDPNAGWGGNPNDVPILLDLNGNGVEITELHQSTVFQDTTDDGLQNRTAWAGVGDGVLFFDADGDGQISSTREFVFTEWDASAASDIEALKSIFDLNRDGELTSADATWASLVESGSASWSDFKVQITKADGSFEIKTLAQLGIESIDLTADATDIGFSDGSQIVGLTTFTRTDGSTGVAADTMLVSQAQSYRVEESETVAGNGTRTHVQTGYNADGSIAFVNTSEHSADGSLVTHYYDDDGDGVVDRVQEITRVTSGTGTVETVSHWRGADTLSGALTSSVRTTRSADGKSVTIERDNQGGGWFQQIEEQTELSGGAREITISDFAEDGTVLRSSTETVSADGLVRTESVDEDGDLDNDLTLSETISLDATYRYVLTEYARGDGQSATLQSSVHEVINLDGLSRNTYTDEDGDGNYDRRETYIADASGKAWHQATHNYDGSTRSQSYEIFSDDRLTTTTKIDSDYIGGFELVIEEKTTLHQDGSRVDEVTQTNQDGSLRSYEKTSLGADQVTSTTWVDLDVDGTIDLQLERVREVSIDVANGNERVEHLWGRNPDGSVNTRQTVWTSENGLIKNTETAIAQEVVSRVSDITTIGSNDTTRLVETRSQDNTLLNGSESITTSDGLTVTNHADLSGDGSDDRKTVDQTTNHSDGRITRSVANYSEDGTMLSKTVYKQSADRLYSVEKIHTFGTDDHTRTIARQEAADGSVTVTDTRFEAVADSQGNEVMVSVNKTTTSGTGLETIVETDRDGDGVFERAQTSATTLNSDGSRVTLSELRGADGSAGGALLSQSETTVSGNGYTTVAKSDADGDGTFERVVTTETVLKANGERVVTETIGNDDSANPLEFASTTVTTSDDGYITRTEVDRDGNGQFDAVTTSTTQLLNDGGTRVTIDSYEGNQLRSSQTTESSDDLRLISVLQDVDGDLDIDWTTTTIVADDGTRTSTRSQLASDGSLLSQEISIGSGNGLTTTTSSDFDGDSNVDMVQVETMDYLANGDVTTTTEVQGRFGNVISRSDVTVSGNGLLTTTAQDIDGDGVTDMTESASRLYLANGNTVDEETRHAGNGALIYKSTLTTQGNNRGSEQLIDRDGDGIADIKTIVAILDNGDRETRTEFGSGSAMEATIEQLVSADGLSTISKTDRDNDGLNELIVADITTLEDAGVEVREITYSADASGGSTQNIAIASYRTDGNGLGGKVSFDFNGDGTSLFVTDSATTFAPNGDTVITEVTSNHLGTLLSEVETTTSGNGLETLVTTDIEGNGSRLLTNSITQYATGGFAQTIEETRLQGQTQTAYQSQTITQSSDGRVTKAETDHEGDLIADRRLTDEVTLDREEVRTFEDLKADGTAEARFSTTSAANGMSSTAAFDYDADGTIDMTSTIVSSYSLTGERTDVQTETYGTSVAYVSTVTSSADGLSNTTETDVNGDGLIDNTERRTETLNADGSRIVVTETLLRNGQWNETARQTLSADGLHSELKMDKDDDGIVDDVYNLAQTGLDGRVTETKTVYDEDGAALKAQIIKTTGDGLITTIYRGDTDGANGTVQTITQSPIGNGSYDWDNGETGTHILVTHRVTASGIETWKMISQEDGTLSIRVNAETKARILDEAARLYDTVLDRDIDLSEAEVLVKFVSNGELDREALADHLLTSAEFTTRFGNLDSYNYAAFINRLYVNTFERGAGLEELEAHLADRWDGTQPTRASIAADLAESSEHLFVGNTHFASNNDVFLRDLEFERNLDSEFVSDSVRALFDVLYDTTPTSGEITSFSYRLRSESLADLAEYLIGSGYAPKNGAPQNDISAYFDVLNNEDNANQFARIALMHGMNLTLQQVDSGAWSSNLVDTYVARLKDGEIRPGDFLAAVAQSTEYLTADKPDADPESTASLTYLVLDEAATDNNIDLTLDWLGGVDGNSHDNHLDARGHIMGVQIDGGAGNDTIYGGDNDDVLNGEDGIDALRGERGNDLIYFDEDDSEVDGGVGEDTVIYTSDNNLWLQIDQQNIEVLFSGDGNDTLDANYVSEAVTVNGGGGNDRLIGSTQVDVFAGGHGNDTIKSSHGGDAIFGDAGADSIIAGDGGDFVMAGDGHDFVDGGKDDDNIKGGFGDDTIIGGKGDDSIRGNEGDDSIIGGNGDDTIRSGWGNDIIVDDNGDNELKGSLGNDTFVVGTDMAYNRIFGGKDTDTLQLVGVSSDWDVDQVDGAHYSVTNGSIYIDMIDVEHITYGDGTTQTLQGVNASHGSLDADLTASTDTSVYTSVEDGSFGHEEWLSGYEYSVFHAVSDEVGEDYWTTHWFAYAGFTGDNIINARAGDDGVNGGGGDDTLNGSYGNDTLSGEAGNDVLTGGSGEDVVSGGAGDDTIDGGSGRDMLDGISGSNSISGGSGEDTIFGGSGDDTLSGGEGDDSISGGNNLNQNGNDIIAGNEGNDTIYGHGGDDSLDGGDGNDLVIGGDGIDTLLGEIGNDSLYGEDGDDSVRGGVGFDVLVGGEGNDTLVGNQNDDFLSGGDGDDNINGGYDNDLLQGGKGNDTLKGGDIGVNGGDTGVDIASFYDLETYGVNADLVAGTAIQATTNDTDTLINIDNLIGTKFDDTLKGDDNNNELFGEEGADSIEGGLGNDILYGNGDDDNLWGENGSDVISGGAGDDSLWGNQSNDNLDGGSGDDLLDGGFDNDSIAGGEGDDRLIGNKGNDTLTGGDGADVFAFKKANNQGGELDLGSDTITDFELGVDKLEFDGYAYADLTFSSMANGLLIEFGQNSVLLDGINLASLPENDGTYDHFTWI